MPTPREGDVYFSVRSFDEYGKLSNRRLEDLLPADQGEPDAEQARKRDPLDFALWKAQKPGEDTAWDSPWGRGRPGWHIECSAMAEEILGLEFDIHGGGSDLMFPHHENEIAQTEAGRGRPLARLWMHNGMIRFGEEKMAKSVGNVTTLADALDQLRPGRADRLHARRALPRSRSPSPRSAWRRRASRRGGSPTSRGSCGAPATSRQASADPGVAALREEFFAALRDDFNTPEALAALFKLVSEGNRRIMPAAPCRALGRASRRCSRVLGLERHAGRARGGRRGRAAPRAGARGRAAGAGLRPRGRGAGRAAQARLGGARHVPRARCWSRRRQLILYGRNAVLEALRGRRAVRRVWVEDDRLGEAVRAAGVPFETAGAAALEELCGSPAHQGIVCEADPYPYADPAALLAADQRARGRARPGPGSAEPGRDLPQRRGRGRDRGRDPGAACRRDHAGRLPGIRGRGRASARSRGSATSPTSWPRPSARGPGCTARTPAAARLYTDVDWAGRSVLVLGSEGRGLRPRVREACDDLVRLPLHGRVESLNVSAAAAVLLYEAVRSRAAAARALTSPHNSVHLPRKSKVGLEVEL